MPEPRLRSRSRKRRKVRTPGGWTIHYRLPRPKGARCARCKKPLQGSPKSRVAAFRNLAKTQKTPTRPYGGFLCHSCLRALIVESARSSP